MVNEALSYVLELFYLAWNYSIWHGSKRMHLVTLSTLRFWNYSIWHGSKRLELDDENKFLF